MVENIDEYNITGPSFFDLVSRLGDLYVSFRQRYVLMREDGQTYVPSKGGAPLPLSNKALSDHLNHRYAVCVYAGSHSSKFLCFDVDDGSRESVRKIINTLAEIGFEKDKIYVSTSGGKGYHVELFFNGLMYTDKLRRVYDYVCGKNSLDTAKIEFRPTAGMSIKLPLSIHRKTHNVCWFLDQETFEPIERQEFLMEICQHDAAMAATLIQSLPYIAEQVCEPTQDNVSMVEADYEVLCGDSYPDVRREGERHKLMVQIAVHNRYRGLSPDANKDELVRWYRRQNERLMKASEREALTDIDQIIRWAYRDRFQTVKRAVEITFTKADLKMLAAQPVQSRRKVMFYILLCEKKYGHATASAQQIADLFGLSRQGAIKALKQLEGGRWIVGKKNRCATKAAGIIRLPNTYHISDSAIGWAKGLVYGGVEVDEKREYDVKKMSFKQDEINIDPDIKMEAESIQAAYTQILIDCFEIGALRILMTKKEFEELEVPQNG